MIPHSFPLALLAGGLGTRLGSVAAKIPKAMVEVAGEPFIAHQLRLLRREGVPRVVLCVGHLGEQIKDFVGDGARFGLEVCYSWDAEEPLGTGGALRRALPLLGEVFWVMYGDSYLDGRFAPVADFFLAQGKPALMTVFRNEGRWDRSNAFFQDGRVIRYDKCRSTPEMKHIDYGLGVLRKAALAAWRDGEAFDLARVYARLAEQGEMSGYEMEQRFYEIGSPAGLAETGAYLAALAGDKSWA